MSFTQQLLPELQSLVFSFLVPQHLLSTCSHISRAVARAALTPSSFRTRLLLDDNAIDALPTVCRANFSLLTRATALVIEYSQKSTVEISCHSLFSAVSSRSLLYFTHIRSLDIRLVAPGGAFSVYRCDPPLDMLTRSLAKLSARFDAGAGGGRGSDDAGGGQLLPCLTHLTIRGTLRYCLVSLTPLSALRSLTHLDLQAVCLQPSHFRQLLQLDSLQALTYWEHPSDVSGDDVAAREALRARGVQIRVVK